jgi:hypothetical protein
LRRLHFSFHNFICFYFSAENVVGSMK